MAGAAHRRPPRCARGTPRVDQFAAVERDLAQVGERRPAPERPLHVAVVGQQLELQLDGAVVVAGEARELARADERLGEPARRQAVAPGCAASSQVLAAPESSARERNG